MKAFRTLGAALVAALSLVVVGAGPSWACSCAVVDTAGHVSGADVVLVGTLTEVDPPPKRAVMSSTDPASFHVDVERVLKGTSGPQAQIRSANSGASCGLEGMEPGRRYVFFAVYGGGEGGPPDALWANLCGGTGRATASLVAEVEKLTGAGAAPGSAEAEGAAYTSDLQLAVDEEEPQDLWLTDYAWPLGVVAGASLLLLTVPLWVRLLRR
jgi:hypothetical protein